MAYHLKVEHRLRNFKVRLWRHIHLADHTLTRASEARYTASLTDGLAVEAQFVLNVDSLVALVPVARVAHVQVAALDALVAPALVRRVLAAAGAGRVALRVVAAVALLARDRVAGVAVTVTFAPVEHDHHFSVDYHGLRQKTDKKIESVMQIYFVLGIKTPLK